MATEVINVKGPSLRMSNLCPPTVTDVQVVAADTFVFWFHTLTLVFGLHMTFDDRSVRS